MILILDIIIHIDLSGQYLLQFKLAISFIVNFYRAYIFATSPQLWAGDRILDLGCASVQYSVTCPQLWAGDKYTVTPCRY